MVNVIIVWCNHEFRKERKKNGRRGSGKTGMRRNTEGQENKKYQDISSASL